MAPNSLAFSPNFGAPVGFFPPSIAQPSRGAPAVEPRLGGALRHEVRLRGLEAGGDVPREHRRCGYFSGNQLPYLGALDLFGRMVVGLGLVTLAVALFARSGAAARGARWLTLALGAAALLPYLYVYLATPGAILASLPAGTQYGGRLPYTPITLAFPLASGANLLLVFALLEAGFALVWGVCWLALGRNLLRQPDGGAPAASPTPQLGFSA